MGFTLAAQETAHAKPLYFHTLVLHGIYISRPLKLPLKSECVATHWHYMGSLVDSWNCPCKAIVLPHIGITWGSLWSAHEVAHVKPLVFHTWYYVGLTLVSLYNDQCATIVFPHIGIKAWALGMPIIMAQIMPMMSQLWGPYKLNKGWPLNTQCLAHVGKPYFKSSEELLSEFVLVYLSYYVTRNQSNCAVDGGLNSLRPRDVYMRQ